MRLIGLHARLHAGKDTAFDTVRQAAAAENLVAVRQAFADPLKISGMRVLGLAASSFGTDPAEDFKGGVIKTANHIKETGTVTVSWYDGDILRVHAITGRQLWQYYGTEAHRAEDLGSSFGPDFWVDNLLPADGPENEDYNALVPWHQNFPGADIAVVTDVRFANEAQRILGLGGEVWWIDAEERLGPNEDGHASEQKLPDEFITVTINNNGSLVEFQNNILAAL